MLPDNSWPLFFKGTTAQPPANSKHIVIRPKITNYNNFSYICDAVIEIVPDDGRTMLEISAYVVPSDENFTDRLANWIKEKDDFLKYSVNLNRPVVNRNGVLIFITLFDSVEQYKKLREWAHSVDEICHILAAINDFVYLENNDYHTEVYKLRISSPFKFGALRSPETYRAMRRGWRIVQGIEIAQLSETRVPFHFRTQLHGFADTYHDLDIGFKKIPFFEDRIHCLIGVNGTGKTRLLRELALTLAQQRYDQNYHSPVFPHDKSEAIHGSKNEYEGQNYNRLLVFSADMASRFPSNSNDNEHFEYNHINLVRDFKIGEEKFKKANYDRWTVAVIDLLRQTDLSKKYNIFGRDEENCSINRFDVLIAALRNNVEIKNLYLPIFAISELTEHHIKMDEQGGKWVNASLISGQNEQRQLDLFAHIDIAKKVGFFVQCEDGEGIRCLHLSSGQDLFFRFALSLIGTIDTGTLVIVDEPETHLHPNLICDFMSLLYKTLNVTKSIALIATHSAYVVREVPTHCVHVLHFIDDTQKIEMNSVRMKTLGASIDSISQAIFGDATREKYHEIIAKKIADSGESFDVILEKYAQILSPELLIDIQSAMEGARQ
jgi:ABC-type Mn2+/Zn2+ transport system ATPase subunit